MDARAGSLLRRGLGLSRLGRVGRLRITISAGMVTPHGCDGSAATFGHAPRGDFNAAGDFSARGRGRHRRLLHHPIPGCMLDDALGFRETTRTATPAPDRARFIRRLVAAQAQRASCAPRRQRAVEPEIWPRSAATVRALANPGNSSIRRRGTGGEPHRVSRLAHHPRVDKGGRLRRHRPCRAARSRGLGHAHICSPGRRAAWRRADPDMDRRRRSSRRIRPRSTGRTRWAVDFEIARRNSGTP